MRFKKAFALHFLTYRFFYLIYLLITSFLILIATYIKTSQELIPSYIYLFIAITCIQTFLIAYFENFRLGVIYLNINGSRISWLISSFIFGIFNCFVNLLLFFLLNILFAFFSNIYLLEISYFYIYLFLSSLYTLTYSISSLLGIMKTHKNLIFKIIFVILFLALIIVFPFITNVNFNWDLFTFKPGTFYLMTSGLLYVLSIIIYLIFYFKIKKMEI